MTAWSDDFTSPTLHERWQLLEGDYTPPGLTDATVLGPQISDSCLIGLTADPVGDYVQMIAIDSGFSPVVEMQVLGTGYVSLQVGDYFSESVPLTGIPSLRRQGGMWTVLVDGQPASDGDVTLSTPDEGGDLYLALQVMDSTITRVSYTPLAETVAPSLSWGGDIQSLWWDGPVDAVYMGATLVWSAVVHVTPAAPTFLAASPWYTFPTQEGVTYTVSGTPGYSQTVTVTATAQQGYELVGNSSWTHTYPSFYPVSGTWSGTPMYTDTVMDSHTIVEAGTFTVTHGSLTAVASIRYPGGTRTGNYGGTTTWTGTLSVGDLLEFTALSFGSQGTGTWTVTKQ